MYEISKTVRGELIQTYFVTWQGEEIGIILQPVGNFKCMAFLHDSEEKIGGALFNTIDSAKNALGKAHFSIISLLLFLRKNYQIDLSI